MQASTLKPKLRKGAMTPLFYLPSTGGGQSGPAALRSKYNMVLVFVDASDDGAAYLHALRELYPAILEAQARIIAVVPTPLESAQALAAKLKLPFPLLADADGSTTQRMLSGNSLHALCVADRFGQVYYLEIAPSVGELPTADTAHDWLAFIQIQCPE
jgi:peroxiredoxin